MRLLADHHNRCLLLSLGVVLCMNALAVQIVRGRFSPALLFLSLAAGAAVLLLCVLYLKKRDDMMENAAMQIRSFLSGRRDARIPCNEEGELGSLFQSINTLAAVLDAKAEQEKRTSEFLRLTISDISHQLKTPLSALGIYTELMGDAESMEDVKRFADASGAELSRIDTLVKNLLKLTRLDAGAVIFEKHPEDIAEIMEDLKERFSCRAELENKQIHLTGESKRFVCDAEWLTEAFANLIKNALDHTSEGGTVSAEWKTSGNILNVTFRDNGCGIHPEDMGHIFKRFYRSRFLKDTQGIGLGLPLAKSIIEAHGGMIEAESELGHGTVFSVNFLIPTEL